MAKADEESGNEDLDGIEPRTGLTKSAVYSPSAVISSVPTQVAYFIVEEKSSDAFSAGIMLTLV